MALLQLVDELVIGLMRIVGTADIDAGICYTGKDERVGHHADRGCIQYDVVIFFAQCADGIFQRLACQEFRWIGRDGATQYQAEVGRDAGRLYQRMQVCGLGGGKILCDSFLFV